MKKIYTIALTAVAVIAIASCGNSNKEQTVSGVIVDATMNNISITDGCCGDTLLFSTMDAEKLATDGIVLGDSATITFKGELIKGFTIHPNSAIKVVVKSAESPLFGSWVEPIPGMDGVQGIKIERGGAASSVNMATLTYESWTQNGNELTLSGKSEGNGQTIDFTMNGKINKLDADSLVVTFNDGMVLRYGKQK